MADQISTRGSVSTNDWLKGIIVAVGTPILILLQQLIPSWTPFLTDKMGVSGALILQAALGALATYMLKQLGTDTVQQSQNILISESKKLDTPSEKQSLVSPINDAISDK